MSQYFETATHGKRLLRHIFLHSNSGRNTNCFQFEVSYWMYCTWKHSFYQIHFYFSFSISISSDVHCTAKLVFILMKNSCFYFVNILCQFFVRYLNFPSPFYSCMQCHLPSVKTTLVRALLLPNFLPKEAALGHLNSETFNSWSMLCEITVLLSQAE